MIASLSYLNYFLTSEICLNLLSISSSQEVIEVFLQNKQHSRRQNIHRKKEKQSFISEKCLIKRSFVMDNDFKINICHNILLLCLVNIIISLFIFYCTIISEQNILYLQGNLLKNNLKGKKNYLHTLYLANFLEIKYKILLTTYFRT